MPAGSLSDITFVNFIRTHRQPENRKPSAANRRRMQKN